MDPLSAIKYLTGLPSVTYKAKKDVKSAWTKDNVSNKHIHVHNTLRWQIIKIINLTEDV